MAVRYIARMNRHGLSRLISVIARDLPLRAVVRHRAAPARRCPDPYLSSPVQAGAVLPSNGSRRPADATEAQGWTLVAEYSDIASGKDDRRPGFQAALARCRQLGAVLVAARLDRITRRAHTLSQLLEEGYAIRAADMPGADDLMMRIYAAMAQKERELISERTRAALAAAKARGRRWVATGATAHRRGRTRRLRPWRAGWPRTRPRTGCCSRSRRCARSA